MTYVRKEPNRKHYVRLTDLSPLILDSLIQAIRDGNYANVATRAQGINEQTFYNWKKRGEEALTLLDKGGEVPEKEQVYLDFFLLIDQADAQGEMNLLREVRDKFDNWTASMRILEAKYPDRWAKTERHEITGRGGAPVPIKVIEVVRG